MLRLSLLTRTKEAKSQGKLKESPHVRGGSAKASLGRWASPCSGMEIGKLLYPIIPESLDISLMEIELCIGQDVQCRAAYNSKKRQTPDYLWENLNFAFELYLDL